MVMKVTIDMLSQETQTDDDDPTPETLRELASCLRGVELPPDYVAGKTRLRDSAMAELGGSSLAAERAVDRMLARGLVRYDEASRRWHIAAWNDSSTMPRT